MKKTVTILGILFAFLIIYFLQSNFFSWFTIAGIKPNLFVILALFIGLYAGIKPAIGFGLFFGLFLDMVLGRTIGTHTIMLCAVALLGGFFDKNFSKDSRVTIMLMVISSTMLFEIGCYILNILILNYSPEIIYFIRILLIETVYNAILTVILYSAIQAIGYKVEDTFKGQKILTRYF